MYVIACKFYDLLWESFLILERKTIIFICSYWESILVCLAPCHPLEGMRMAQFTYVCNWKKNKQINPRLVHLGIRVNCCHGSNRSNISRILISYNLAQGCPTYGPLCAAHEEIQNSSHIYHSWPFYQLLQLQVWKFLL